MPSPLHWTPHPLLDRTMPPVPDADLRTRFAAPEGQKVLMDYWQAREDLIKLAGADPLRHGFEPDAWAEADRQAHQARLLAHFGTNRGGKTWRAAKRVVESALTFRHGLIVVMGETVGSSYEVQQETIYQYLRVVLAPFLGKRSKSFHVNWTPGIGFSEARAVLPFSETKLHFKTYVMAATDVQGWELGANVAETERSHAHRQWLEKFWGQTHTFITLANGQRACRLANGRIIQNIAWWADESCSLNWLQTLHVRGGFRQALGVWTFTPVFGLTPAMKELVGTKLEIEASLPAALLPTARLDGCPPGHMPTVARPTASAWASQGVRMIWWHVGSNPFGDYTAQIKRLCEGKDSRFIERVAYGWAADTGQRAFPAFGPRHIVTAYQIPEEGEVVQLVDPHGNRRWACWWVLVTPSDPPDYYCIAEWPDAQTYGEWATATERETNAESRKGWDGDKGPAQASEGWGYLEYLRLFQRVESFTEAGWGMPWCRGLLPFMRRQLQAQGQNNRLDVRQRFADKRFMAAKSAGDTGATCWAWEMAKARTDEAKHVTYPGLDYYPGGVLAEGSASSEMDQGLMAFNTLLAWNPDAPFVPHLNAPRFYVLDSCLQTIWALASFTGLSGPGGACKEWPDLARQLAIAAPQHVGNLSKWRRPGQGF